MLRDYVVEHAVRGACTCGKCFDAPNSPEKHQPNGHTADMVFFKVATKGGTDNSVADKEKFLGKVMVEYSHWMDGQEHSYLEIGADMGDQGLALMTMGMGSVLRAWDLFTPNLLGDLVDESMKKQLAGRGMITIKSKKQI